MKSCSIALLLTVATLSQLQGSDGRGRLIEPPARASMWRFGFKTPINYNDNAISCGGSWIQWGINDGKCGVCGDPFDGERANEAGGRYATGILSRQYREGQIIQVSVEVSADELGWFEFNLCAHNDPSTPVREDCLNRTLLELTTGGTRLPILPQTNGVVSVQLKLPSGLVCSQCVFRWRWNAGNRWGVDPDGRACLGCGQQDQFIGCADVSISSFVTQKSALTTETTAAETTSTTSTKPSTRSTTIITTTSTLSTASLTTTDATLSTTSAAAIVTDQVPRTCHAVNNWAGDPDLDFWCQVNCLQNNYCPPIYCLCA